MVAHTGFLTLARRVQPDAGGSAAPSAPPASDDDADQAERSDPEGA
jgi:hypothetical protein